MFKLVLFIPESHLEGVKAAVFGAGAGKVGNYDQCCWQVAGRGQFRPLDGSQPFLGSRHEQEYVDEFRVEMVCDDESVGDAIAAYRQAHPYEEPAYDVWRLIDL